MPSKHIMETYYAGYERVTVNGLPCRMRFKPSAHALPVMNEKTTERGLKKYECKRHPQTQYVPVYDGVHILHDKYCVVFGGQIIERGLSLKAAKEIFKNKKDNK